MQDKPNWMARLEAELNSSMSVYSAIPEEISEEVETVRIPFESLEECYFSAEHDA